MKRTLYKILALFILTGSVGLGWLWMDYKGFMNNQANLPENGFDLTVTPGATLTSISRNLYNDGIIRSAFYPRIASKIQPQLNKLKTGEYHLQQGMTPREIFLKLVSGEVKVYQIRFIEGWTLKQFLSQLEADKKLKQQPEVSTYHEVADYFEIHQSNPEGWFYPDTYHYQKGTSTLDILQVAHNKMKQMLEKYWHERDLGLPYDAPYQLLIMASIIEKETGLAGERDRIAGVFIRRLNKNMRLQTDPTVIYGMGETYDGNIRKKDLLTDTPYNTYRRHGLPPTPIAMPSAASLQAAVHPAAGTELYFVAKGDGSHQFSTTLEQHNRAVRQYQLKKGQP